MNNILQKLVTTTSLPEDNYLQQDAEILEIFVEELKDIFDELNVLFPKWFKDSSDQSYLKDIRRHFHTLKGSGRMVGANQAGELAWSVEDTLNRVISGSIPLENNIKQFAWIVFQIFERQLYPCFEQLKALTVDVRPYLVLGEQLREQKLQPEVAELLDNTETTSEAVLPHVSPETLEIYLEEATEYVTYIQEFLKEQAPNTKQTDNLIRALHTLKGSSGMAQIETVFHASSQVECALKSHLQQETHLTVAEFDLLTQFSSCLSIYLSGLQQANQSILDQAALEFERVWQQYTQVQKFEDNKQMYGAVCELVALNIDGLLDAEQNFVAQFRQDAKTYLDQLIHECELLSTHTQNNLQDLHRFIGALKDSYLVLKEDPMFFDTADTKELFHQAHLALIHYFDLLATGQTAAIPQRAQDIVGALKQHISPPAVQPQSNVAQHMQLDKETIEQGTELKDKELIDIFLDEAEELLAQIDTDLNLYQADTNDTKALKQLMRYLHTFKGGANMIQASHIGSVAHVLESIYEKLINQQLQVSDELVSTLRLVQDQLAERIDIIRQSNIDFDCTHTLDVLTKLLKQTSVPIAPVSQPTVSDVIHDSFVEEAHELVNELQKTFKKWQDDRSNRSLLLQLQRHAHTFKGGARMVELQPFIDVTQALEDTFENFALHQLTTNAHDKLIKRSFDWLKQAVELGNYSEAHQYQSQLQAIDYIDRTAQIDDVDDIDTPIFVEGDGTEPPSMLGEWETSEQQTQHNEMIRISSSLIEKMVNLTGETSINRSRIEMGMSQFNNTLSDMELAIKRLSDQLRRMEGELETQIIAKHDVENARYADFDPLEMDQYSSLNQLSKSLAESASDLIDFKVTLTDKVRDAESLLLQQSRIQAEIQDNLMSVRLVPFSNVINRLERLVRQTASTLERPVQLKVANRNTELDRNILERLAVPLEHMIRNAIDHGIESADERTKQKKHAIGQLALDIYRQGSDVVITVQDDGRGIDVGKVEKKAQDLGLISDTHRLSDQEILQFIFHSGFTTAESVTQISGRGVGLDVVQSDIKALGGHVSIQSTVGKGTQFSIRIPTAVAVHDALMVKIADQQLAIPLTQIERIVRVSSDVLEDYFDSKDEFFSIDGYKYKLRYAGEFLGHAPKPRFSTAHTVPVLLIKGYNNQTVALLIDQLIGSRAEIVVKPLGVQFEKMDILGGATILGDGQVCLILDGQNIARRIQNTSRDLSSIKDITHKERTRQLVMIVDDSVTVRKVTSRLLERHGYDVVTAKDGIDAIEQIEHIKPNLMLLDIEMPRMDGFEVTNQLRHDPIHKDLPIIMITSRTGEKHRERAFSLGVTHYMGKPFQEAELLTQVQRLIGE